jgi:uncharacterized membrane protein
VGSDETTDRGTPRRVPSGSLELALALTLLPIGLMLAFALVSPERSLIRTALLWFLFFLGLANLFVGLQLRRLRDEQTGEGAPAHVIAARVIVAAVVGMIAVAWFLLLRAFSIEQEK